ncbi:MAG TPA: tetratricopeptide repeat protein [Polyangiales bacterium]|nr:tetratricopeptide repeat protein [Polyangiales bacterium]
MTQSHAHSSLLAAIVALFSVACAHTRASELEAHADMVAHALDPQLLVDKARAFAAAGDYARAEQYLTLAQEHGAAENDVLPLLLEVCVRDQRYRDAIAHVQEHLRQHPGSHRLRFVLASLYAALGDVATARAELERALSREPGNAQAHYALAVLLRDGAADFARADTHFREYLRLAPAGPHAEEASESLLTRLP